MLTRSPSSLIKRSLGPALTCLIFIVWLHLGVTLNNESHYRPFIFDRQYRLPSSAVIQAAALNHRPAAADFVWLSGLLYIGDMAAASRSPDDATKYARAITSIDPYFYEVYAWHSAARMFMSDYPDADDIDSSNELLKVGMRYFPDDWELPFEVVSNYIGFNRRIDADTRLRHTRDAAKYAEITASLPDSPSHMPLLAYAFYKKSARLEQGLSENSQDEVELSRAEREFLIRRYLFSSTKSLRYYAEQQLQSSGLEDDLRDYLEQQRAQADRFAKLDSLRYLPDDLRLLSLRLQDVSTSDHVGNN